VLAAIIHSRNVRLKALRFIAGCQYGGTKKRQGRPQISPSWGVVFSVTRHLKGRWGDCKFLQLALPALNYLELAPPVPRGCGRLCGGNCKPGIHNSGHCPRSRRLCCRQRSWWERPKVTILALSSPVACTRNAWGAAFESSRAFHCENGKSRRGFPGRRSRFATSPPAIRGRSQAV
jgi:hypothetical protein